jgi:hypothetical protein
VCVGGGGGSFVGKPDDFANNNNLVEKQQLLNSVTQQGTNVQKVSRVVVTLIMYLSFGTNPVAGMLLCTMHTSCNPTRPTHSHP